MRALRCRRDVVLLSALWLSPTTTGCGSGAPVPPPAGAGGSPTAGMSSTGGAASPGGASATGGVRATSGGVDSGGAPPTAGSPALDPGRKEIHRLNTAEYNATVTDVLGTALQPGNAHWRGGEFVGFDNIASVQGVDDAQYERYFDAAKALASEVFGSEALRARFLTCELTDATCVRTTLEKAGMRLFRRPLEEEEVAIYRKVYDAALALGDPPLAAVELAFQAMLASGEFLYRIELDPEPRSPEPHALTAFELATRLSYFLWSSAPDDALLALAADRSLLEPATLSLAVDRMLDDPRAERLVSHFAGQWLGARQVISHAVAPELYQWSPPVAHAASAEIVLYFAEFVRSERSWFEFPLADVNYVDGWLSALYGMPTPVGTPARVQFVEDRRAGFFGLAGFLALTSFDRRTSPSLRGRWIAGNLLCETLPKAPPDVPKLEADGEDSSALSVRRLLERHRESAPCAGCHQLFDPYGLALEEYDAIGQPRSVYADGTTVDASAVLPKGSTVVGLEGLARAIASDVRFGECLAEKLLTYGLGRPVTATDEPYLRQVQLDWLAPGQVPSIRRLIHALIASEPFRYRRGELEPRTQP